MRKYKIQDFIIGDEVYHLSNTKLIMVVIEINQEANELSCKWIDNNGNKHYEEFMPVELGKKDDLRPRIRISTL